MSSFLEFLSAAADFALTLNAHVGVAGRQPDPRPIRHRDHRRRLTFASAFISAVTVGASTAPVIRIRPPVANSISITPALSATGGPNADLGSGVIATGLNATELATARRIAGANEITG